MKIIILRASVSLFVLLSGTALAVNDGGTGNPGGEKIVCETCTFLNWLASWWVF